ncbi:MAG: DUF882 domain-containing protein [Rhizobiaceae bacterium]
MHLAAFPETAIKLPQILVARSAVLFLLVSFFVAIFATSYANAETRTLRMYYGHSKESATITFKRNGRYVKSGLRKANRFLRDWRRKEPTRMDPALLDLVWEVYRRSGSRKPIQVISGYRSPRTNKMLRRRGRKVARHSQHTKGKALDFFLPDVSVKKLRALGLKAHRGGVGYYRGSFVHLDTGKVRHWPRMSKRQLSRVFPRGKTIHVPSNGRPLRGYKVAMANLKKGLNADGRKRSTSVRRSLLARIFTPGGSGSRADEEEGARTSRKQRKTPKPKKKTPKAVVVAAKVPEPKPKPVRAKVKGVDPFSKDSKAEAKRVAALKRKLKEATDRKTIAAAKAADKARADANAEKDAAAKEILLAKAKAAEELAKKVATQTQLAALAPAATARIALPTRRPALQASTQLALAPSAGTNSLRPAVLSADKATEIALAEPKQTVSSNQSDVDALSSRTVALLARQRKLLAAQQGSAKQTATNLTEQLTRLPMPTAAKRAQPPKELIVAALSPEQARAVQAPVVADQPITKPSYRASTDAAQVPVPSSTPTARPQDGTVALETGAPGQMQSELKLGNLDGHTVKKWAVARSTRVGLSANLRAPVYKRSTNRAAPASVFSVGFAFVRSPLRADRFSGRSLTRVAFAHFGQNN